MHAELRAELLQVKRMTHFDRLHNCAHRASSKIDARLGGRLALIRRDAIEKKFFLLFFFGDLARAQRGRFRLFSQHGAQNGPRSPCYAYCRSRGGCRPSTTAEVCVLHASVRAPDSSLGVGGKGAEE